MGSPGLQKVVKLTKVTALLSAGWTILCAVMIIGWQVSSGVEDSSRLSSIVKILKSDQKSTYVTANSTEYTGALTTNQVMIDWLLQIPALVPLVIVAALLLLFYRRLAVIEKGI